jgi:hypothetical protein
MGVRVAIFVERFADDTWHEERALRGWLDSGFRDVLRKKRSLVTRGVPHNVSASVEEALGELGDDFGDASFVTLRDFQKLPLDTRVEERRLLGPIFWKERQAMGENAPTRGSLFHERTLTILASLGARLVSNEEMDRYVDSDAFNRETRGLTDGECKLFTVLELLRTVAEEIGVAGILKSTAALGPPDDVRLIWSIEP